MERKNKLMLIAAIGAVVVTAGIFAISYGLSAILNAIPIVKKYLV